MLLKNKTSFLKKINSNVLLSKEERYCYSFDALNARERREIPERVEFVETIDDVCRIVKYAFDNSIPIVPRGAGSNMVGACICKKGSIVLNFSKMNKILEFNKTNMTIKVQPGVVLDDLMKYVEKEGLYYPAFPSSFKIATIGGAIAQSSGGALSLKYGTTKDYILSMKVVTSNGEVITLGSETIKEAAGYHLGQLMIGSEGTLGIIVEAVIKLIPRPDSKKVICAFFNDYDSAVNSMNDILCNGILPSAVDFMNKNSIITVEEYKSCGLNKDAKCMLLIDVDGNEEKISKETNIINEILINNNGYDIIDSKTDEEYDEFWNARRSSYSAVTRLAPDVISDDIIVPRDKISEIINYCEKVYSQYNLSVCIVGHIGDGNIHPQVALDIENDILYKNYLTAKGLIYQKVIELGGSISAEHGIGLAKINYLEQMTDKKTLEYMKMVKKIFDPKNILNPGKIFKL